MGTMIQIIILIQKRYQNRDHLPSRYKTFTSRNNLPSYQYPLIIKLHSGFQLLNSRLTYNLAQCNNGTQSTLNQHIMLIYMWNSRPRLVTYTQLSFVAPFPTSLSSFTIVVPNYNFISSGQPLKLSRGTRTYIFQLLYHKNFMISWIISQQ